MLEDFKKTVEKTMVEFPVYRDEIQASYQLALDEIEGGGSIQHEIDICYSDIEQIIDPNN